MLKKALSRIGVEASVHLVRRALPASSMWLSDDHHRRMQGRIFRLSYQRCLRRLSASSERLLRSRHGAAICFEFVALHIESV
mmetsp:Transcript_41641/g.131706  ORF Transcript_41641/g.131706 Transcript_41641/m.131706 type:complete len:82 (-) Transcript_41641:154-399(-)